MHSDARHSLAADDGGHLFTLCYSSKSRYTFLFSFFLGGGGGSFVFLFGSCDAIAMQESDLFT